MIARTYPPKNPFPHQGVSSLEGMRLEQGSRQARILPPTHLFGAVEGVRRSLAAYRDGYEPRATKEGRIVVVQGDHGSGKTHTIRYAASRLAQNPDAATGEGEAPPAIRQMYAKADDDRFIAVFRELMGYMDVTYMAELNSAFLESVASETVEDESDRAGLLERFKRDPELISRLFKSGGVEEGAVRSEQAKEIGRVKRHKDFQNALYYGSTVSTLQVSAFKWFRGGLVSEDDRRRLGVGGPLESGDDGKSALGLVSRLFKHAGVPLIFYIDQYEKLVLRPDGSPHVENVGILRSLVEIVAREQGAIVLAGTPAAWSVLTPDIHERVGNNHFELTTLKLNEAKDIVALYLTASEDALGAGHDDASLFPFESDAVRAMLRLGGGNLRRLLQLSSGVFEAAQATEALISAELVEETARERKLKYFDRHTVVAEIEQTLSQRSLSFERRSADVPVKTDFIVTPTGGGTRLLIKVKHALFHDDEAVSALESLNYIAAARQLDPPARVVLVAAGYVSPEVTARIRKVVHELIVYQPDSFASRFATILDDLEAGRSATLAGTAAVQATDEQLSHELGEIRQELQVLAQSRGKEAELLEARFTRLLKEQSAVREAERRADIWDDWAQERDRIRQKIQEARRVREARDLEEMASLQHIAERKRWRRALLMAGGSLVAGIGLGIYLHISSGILDVPKRMLKEGVFFNSALFEVGLAVGLLCSMMFLAMGWYFNLRFSDLARSFGSREELRRAARTLEDNTLYLWHPIPQVRYAMALSRNMKIQDEAVLDALSREPSVLVRDVLAREAGRRLSQNEEFPPELEPGTRGAAYFLEARSRYGKDPDGFLPLPWRKSGTMATLVAICDGLDVGKSPSLAAALALLNHSKEDRQSPLAEAFEQGLSPDSVTDLRNVSRSEVERAVAELSPFDQGGLGTFDELKCIREVDAYYLFFRQLLFVMERGAIGPSSD